MTEMGQQYALRDATTRDGSIAPFANLSLIVLVENYMAVRAIHDMIALEDRK